MPFDDQQKKQAVILLLLVGVLGIVFYFMDPFGLFKKNTPLTSAQQKKVEETKKKSQEALKNKEKGTDPAKPDGQDPKNDTVKKAENVNLDKTTMDLDELIPENYVYDVYTQMNPKTAYKADIFEVKGKTIGETELTLGLDIIGKMSSGGENQVKFGNVMPADAKKNAQDYMIKGDEFYYKNKKYRILEIKIGYDSKTKSFGYVKVLNVMDGDKDYNKEFTEKIPLK